MGMVLQTPAGWMMLAMGVLGAGLALAALLRCRRSLAFAGLVCGVVSLALGVLGTWGDDRVVSGIAEPAQLTAAQHEALRTASHKEALTWTFAGVTLGGPATLLALGALVFRRARASGR
jgi:hypothetical protein